MLFAYMALYWGSGYLGKVHILGTHLRQSTVVTYEKSIGSIRPPPIVPRIPTIGPA